MKSNPANKGDKRVYTLMMVPHRGDKTYSFSISHLTIKKLLAGMLCILLIIGGLQFRHMLIVWQAQNEHAELEQLRANRVSQEERLKTLANITENMQTEMGKINQLEMEVRRSLGAEEGGVSRSGVSRGDRGQLLPAIFMYSADELITVVQNMNAAAIQKQVTLSGLNEQLLERNAIRAATPSIWPAEGEVTSRFGRRNSPNGIGSSNHDGLDIAGAYGSPIYAAADGVVDMATYYYGYGLYVRIDHGYGLQTAYGHNSAIEVSVGQRIKKGQVIAYMGNSGVSTGTHVHYEIIKNGEPVNPADFL